MTRIKILLIGVFHMDQYLDFVQKKQVEISDLVDRMAVFNPTKIAVEWRDDDAEGLSNSFRDFTDYGNFTSDEICQLGFRLAKKLKHDRLYPVDHVGKITEDELNQLLTEIESNYPSVHQKLTELNSKQIQINQDVSLVDVIAQLNDHDFVDELRRIYLSFCEVTKGSERWGIDFLAKWHERELGIFSNISRLSAGGEDNILLFIGGDHLWTLSRLLEDSGCFDVQGPVPFLSDNNK